MKNRSLTFKQLEFYKDNGYVIIKKFFKRTECERLMAIFKEHASPDFSALMNIDRQVSVVRDMIQDGRIADVIEPLHDYLPMDYLMTQVLFKMPNTPFAKHAWNPHQDNHYIRHPDNMGVSAIIAIENSDHKNGGMYLYPGTHKLPVIYHEPHKSNDPNENPGNKAEIPPEFADKKLDLNMDQGDLYIQHGNLIHGSYSNESNRSRIQFGITIVVRNQPFNTHGQTSNRLPQTLRKNP